MGNRAHLQVIQGGRVKSDPKRLNQHEKQSIAARFLYHDAHLFPLAWKAEMTQHEVAWIAVEVARAEAFENGMKAERARMRLMPPMERVAA
jgi:hypothetical protein